MQIIVLGMHESGAEQVARLIDLMAASAGSGGHAGNGGLEAAANAWRQLDVRRLNDRALRALGKSWFDCADLHLGELPRNELSELRRTANDIVNSLNGHGPWVAQDPCMSLLLELWRPLLAEPLYVLVHRSATDAAQLVRERHGLPAQLGLALWERYNIAALSGMANCPGTLVNYDQLLSDAPAALRQLRADLMELGVNWLGDIPQDVLQTIQEGRSAVLRTSGDAIVASRAQRRLEARLCDRSVLNASPPAVSAPAAAVLKRAGERWVGQRWLVRLLRQRNRERLGLHRKLKAVRRQAIAADGRSKALQNVRDAGGSRGVFVIGCPRSGTSILSWALAMHANFWTSAESDYLLRLFGDHRLQVAYMEAYERRDEGWLHKEQVSFAEFAAMLGSGVERLFDSRAGGRRWVDATPGHTLMVEALLGLFPAANFVHIVRDGRAVVNSMLSSGFDAKWASNFDAACASWVHYASLGRQAVEDHSDRVIEVRHEDLTRNPWFVLSRVFYFLGERVSQDAIDLILTQRINSSYGNAAAADVKKPKNPAAAPARPWEAWTEQQQAAFAAIAGATMRRLGYDGFDNAPANG